MVPQTFIRPRGTRSHRRDLERRERDFPRGRPHCLSGPRPFSGVWDGTTRSLGPQVQARGGGWNSSQGTYGPTLKKVPESWQDLCPVGGNRKMKAGSVHLHWGRPGPGGPSPTLLPQTWSLGESRGAGSHGGAQGLGGGGNCVRLLGRMRVGSRPTPPRKIPSAIVGPTVPAHPEAGIPPATAFGSLATRDPWPVGPPGSLPPSVRQGPGAASLTGGTGFPWAPSKRIRSCCLTSGNAAWTQGLDQKPLKPQRGGPSCLHSLIPSSGKVLPVSPGGQGPCPPCGSGTLWSPGTCCGGPGDRGITQRCFRNHEAPGRPRGLPPAGEGRPPVLPFGGCWESDFR